MSGRRRIIFGLSALALAFAGVVFWPGKSAPPEKLLLPDGTTVSIVGVTYGTNHVYGTTLARLVAKLPKRIGAFASGVFASGPTVLHTHQTSEPSLVVWLDRSTNVPAAMFGGYVSVLLVDETGFVSGDDANIWSSGSALERLSFRVIPRRNPEVTVNFSHRGREGEGIPVGSLSYPNPLYSKYPQWSPERLPATKVVGDVEVTLSKVSVGHGSGTSVHSTRDGGRVIEFGTNNSYGRVATVCLLSVRSLADSNLRWRVTGVTVSDATGNAVKNSSMSWGGEDDPYFMFSPGLWPGEDAWELSCELKRANGFEAGEQFTFRNVPLGAVDATNRVGWTTNFQGLTVTLDYFHRRPPNTNDSWSSSELSQIHFTHSPLLTNAHLDLVSVTLDTGETVASGSSSSSSGDRSYSFRNIPREAKSADITFALHQSRWVEFIVKPEIRTARLEIPPHDRK